MDTAQGSTAVARLLARVWLHRSGTIAIKFALVLPLLMSGVAMAVDYGWLTSRQSQLQIAADAAALAGAKELSLSGSKRENVPAVVGAVVQAYAASSSGAGANLKVSAEIVNDPLQVRVTVSAPVKAYFAQLPGLPENLTVTSVARVLGKPNVCVLALDPSAAGAISLEKNSVVTGNGCSVYSNSAHINSIRSKDSATLKASFICARGGKDGWKGNFDPEPMTDCPGFEDPLSDRPEPSVGACMENKLVINGGAATLNPGTYTAIVARVLELTEGPSIVLNSNYDQTNVPVPAGIRGAGQPVALVK